MMVSIGDTLYAITEWLRTTQLVELSLWISNQKLSMAIDTHFWAIPIFQTIHILAIAAAFGSVVLLNFRILGLAGNSRSLARTSERYVPWIWWSLLVLVVTGFGMIIGEPVRELVNPIFWIKMGLIICMVLLSIWFQASVRRNIVSWEATAGGRAGIRFGAAGLILLWCAIIFAGRWIAYAPT